MKKVILIAMAVALTLKVGATSQFVTFKKSEATLPLHSASLAYSNDEHSCVARAVASLASDFEMVTGRKPAVEPYAKSGNSQAGILIGTIGCNKQIDQWAKKGLLPDLKGKTEKYIISVIGQQLVIAGSDKRGTVYGVYELSRQMGVSPWYWWADVPVERHSEVYAMPGIYTDGEPAVRYRGLFINDEAPCLTSWVKNTFGTNYGDHRFYEKVFELILRLKGNYLWPAMWSWAFYADDPLNSKTADEMGIVMGTSHHEPMARNHQEWARHRKEYGAWNYSTNQEVIDKFFREGIERMKNTDDIVTIGMRGDGDEAMSEDADVKLLQRVVENQRRIIKDVTGKPANRTPQVWALYKEVLEYYEKGMRVPDDVIMMLCDDNWGNLRRVPIGKERNHPGGWGLYYHVDYVGAPRNSKWLNVTPAQNMWEQLTLAHQSGIDKIWILNVGDIKPMEYPITLFMDMAWNPNSVERDVVATHTLDFCRQTFGEAHGKEAARLLNRVSKLNGRCTAEMLDARTYNLATGEWQQVADDYMRLEAEALRLFAELPERYHDAYRQIVLFPVQAMANVYQMYYAQAMNLSLYANNDPEANLWADRVEEAFRRDSMLCAQYNHDIAGGKWNGMMTQKHIGYTSWNDDFPADKMPRVQRVANTELGGFSFEADNGLVVMEAPHYFEAHNTGEASWTLIPDMGRTLGAMSLMPYTVPTGDASLTYRFNADGWNADSVDVRVVVKSTLDYLAKGGLTYTVKLDGGDPVTVNFNSRLNEDKENIYSIFYPTVARRVVESKVRVPLGRGNAHTLTLHPNDPAVVFEKIVIDAGGYKPSYLFGNESRHRR